MTKDQFQRWQDFALRMARVTTTQRPDFEWVESALSNFFSLYEDRYYEQVKDWDQTCTDLGLLCDHASNFLWQRQPSMYWKIIEKYEENDQEFDDQVVEDREYAANEQWHRQWNGPVLACLRAGLDVVTEWKHSVWGLQVSHLREMYPEGIPDWLEKTFEDSLQPTLWDHILEVKPTLQHLPADYDLWL